MLSDGKPRKNDTWYHVVLEAETPRHFLLLLVCALVWRLCVCLLMMRLDEEKVVCGTLGEDTDPERSMGGAHLGRYPCHVYVRGTRAPRQHHVCSCSLEFSTA